MRVMMVMRIIARPIGIPITAPVAYAPSHRIPSTVIIGTIPGIVIPGVPMPGVVHIGYRAPIPGVVEMTSMETCQTKAIIEIHVVTVGVSLAIALAIP